MTQEYDKTIQDLLDWNICERNGDSELKPTADFLVWYYDYLLSQVSQFYGEEWEETIDPDNMTEKQWDEIRDRDKEKDEFIKDCIRNQIVGWTSQKVGRKLVAELKVSEHVNVVHSLINEIDSRLMNTHMRKTCSGNENKEETAEEEREREREWDELLNRSKQRNEEASKAQQDAEERKKKEAEKQQRKLSDYDK